MSEKIRKLKEDASRLIAKGKVAEACECYEKVVKVDLHDLTARQKLAELYARQGRKEQAVHAYQSVAGSYAADGLLLKAIAVCKIILQIDPSHTETQNILAELSTKRRGTDAPAGENVVEMPTSMSSAVPGAKRSAKDIRGVAADHIRGVPSERLRPVTNPALAAPGSTVPPRSTPPTASPAPALDAASRLQEATAMLAPVVAAPNAVPAAARADALAIDIAFDDADPIALGNSLPEAPTAVGVPVLSAAIAAATPSFDELMESVAGQAASDAPAQGASSASTRLGNTFDPPPGFDDDLGNQPVGPARVDVDSVPAIPLFSDLPRDAFIALTEQMELRVVSTNDVLIQEGEAGTSMFIIIQGCVKVVRNVEGVQTHLAELSDGAFFGEMALLSDAPRTASVVATEESMLFEISRDLLTSITREHPSVGEVMKKFHKNRLITNLLKTSLIFRPFSTTDKKLLIEKFKSRQVAEGTYLISREKPGDGLYVVLSGRCAVLDKNAHDGDVIIAELKEGDVFGEMSMLWNKDTCASVRAQTTCVVLRLPRQNFSEVIMTHPQILETLATLSEKREKQNVEMKAAGIASDFLI